MIGKSFLVVIAGAMLTMCSTKSVETDQGENAGLKVRVKTVDQAGTKSVVKTVVKTDGAGTSNENWEQDIDELMQKTAGLAALADTSKCVPAHDALTSYMNTNQKRLEELTVKVLKMKHTLPAEKQEAYQKKMATEFDKSIPASLESMKQFAMLCCNKELDQKKAWALEAQLNFIRILKEKK